MIKQLTSVGMVEVYPSGALTPRAGMICYRIAGDPSWYGPFQRKCECMADIEDLAQACCSSNATLTDVTLNMVDWQKYKASVVATTGATPPQPPAPGQLAQLRSTDCVMADGYRIAVREDPSVAKGLASKRLLGMFGTAVHFGPVHCLADVQVLYDIHQKQGERLNAVELHSDDYDVFWVSEVVAKANQNMTSAGVLSQTFTSASNPIAISIPGQITVSPDIFATFILGPNKPKCECGSVKIGCPTHSDWCPCHVR